MNLNESIKEFFQREDIKKQAIADLAEIIAIPSVAGEPEGENGKFPYGEECAKALDKATELAEKYGFKVENHDYHCLSVLYGDSDTEIGIVCHLDVVPAGDGWSVEPYALTEMDGLLLGRGTHDDKGPFIQSLYTMRFFKENNIKLPFTIRLILGSDEEVGSSDLEYFVTVRKPPMFSFTPDSEFPVCIGEKSILSIDIEFPDVPDSLEELQGGTVSNAVPGKAFAVANGKKYEAEGKSAHAAMPEAGVNAISLILKQLADDGISNKTLDFISKATSEYLGNTLGINESNDSFGYLTCVGGVIQLKDGKIVQSFNIRHLPETKYNVILEKIQKSVEPYNGKVNVVAESEGYFVSADDDKIKALTKACEDVLGIKCQPYTMGGGTYARWLPNTVAFGSGIESERHFLGDEKGNAHQRDEYISKKEFFMGMEIYSRGIGNLSEIL